MSKAILKAEALQRVRRALALIEQAQNDLNSACQQLSSLRGGYMRYRATGTLRDNVHQHWYRVQKLLHSKRLTLDGVNAQEFLKKITNKGSNHVE